ncbi:MAG: TrkH family potassium uptake protein [Oscillospiraceae bacterium]|nr:TrkH family potassium uptake protein [Oscillospiraceae bacterium]
MNKRYIINLLGYILLIEAAFMLLPVAVGLYYHEQSWIYFLCTAVIGAAVGILMVLTRPNSRALFAKGGFVTVALGWILMSLVGAIPFTMSGQIPSYLDAVFETVSGFTTTGASILTNIEALDRCMLFWRSFTHWLGGMGVLVFMLAVIPLAGGQTIHLLRAESPGPTVSKIVPKMRTSSSILYGIYLGLTILEILLLRLGGMPMFDSLCNAFGTAGTGGFSIWNNSMAHYNSYYLQGVVTVFMALFGLNFTVYFYFLLRKPMMALKNTELRWYLGLMLGAIAIITFNIRGLFPTLFDAFHHAAFTTSSVMTTTGYCTADFNTWPELSRLVLVFLMFIGACAGSTGGGIKVSRIVIMVKSTIQEVRKLVHPRSVTVVLVDGKRVTDETVRGVHSYMMIYILVTVLSILLVSLDNFDFTTTVTSVIATLNNIGPGLGLVGATGNYAGFSAMSKIVLSLDMLFGRLELFPMLILMLPSTWRRN